MLACVALYRCWGSKLCLHACVTSAVPTEPSPQPSDSPQHGALSISREHKAMSRDNCSCHSCREQVCCVAEDRNAANTPLRCRGQPPWQELSYHQNVSGPERVTPEPGTTRRDGNKVISCNLPSSGLLGLTGELSGSRRWPAGGFTSTQLRPVLTLKSSSLVPPQRHTSH